MNHMLGFPEEIRERRVFEPFAGSGALGFMALKAGAQHVDFLDINPRAAEFHRGNADLNSFSSDQFATITGDIFDFVPEQKYDLILANPPFVPTPPGVEGTLTSNGGSDGSLFVDVLLDRFEEFMDPSGRALVYVLQFAREARPLMFERLSQMTPSRSVEVTPAQEKPIPFEVYVDAYRRIFSDSTSAIDSWRSDLRGRHGDGLTLCHYVVDIGPRSDRPGDCVIRENFSEKFGDQFLVPSEDEAELALARVFENLVPPAL
jgi:methylase of polypeptide subunit release factors